MLRTTMIAVAAIATLSAASLAPTAASAKGGFHGGGHHGGYHGGYRGGRFRGVGFGLGVVGAGLAYNTCMQRRWVETPYGARLRWVNVCY